MRREKDVKAERTPIDTLVIVGNGFDIWHGLSTDYREFQEYYLKNRKAILKKLHIKEHRMIDENGVETTYSDVELIYGNPFDPNELDKGFWSTFEASLDKIDAERLNLYFGKDKAGLRQMRRSAKNARRILQEAFCGWIATIKNDGRSGKCSFGENCMFINFNYTDTLVSSFGVSEERDYHVHGEATDKKSIIFGHASHPYAPEPMLRSLRGRLEGLYYVEEILYETDKHVQDNIQAMICYLALMCVMCQDIKHIYVLGHSFGVADIEYFDFFRRATSVETEEEEQAEEGFEGDLMEELFKRIEYRINTHGYGREETNPEYADAIERQYRREQQERNEMFRKDFFKILGKKPQDFKDGFKQPLRTEDAEWHISYFSERDKIWMEAVLKELKFRNYTLYPSIDECLESMNKE